MNDSSESRTVLSPASDGPDTCRLNTFEGLLQEGLERAACFQRIALDLYARQTAGLVSSWKSMFSPSPFAAETALMNLAEGSIVSLIELQKSTLDLLVQSNRKRLDERTDKRNDADVAGQAAAPVNKTVQDEADEVLSDEVEEAQIAARVVDRIAELVGQADAQPLPDAAVQQDTPSGFASHRRQERRRPKRALRSRGSNHRPDHAVPGMADPSSRD